MSLLWILFSMKKSKIGIFGSFSNKKPKVTDTVGASGTAIYGGYVEENEKNPALSGVEKYRTYSNILANCVIVATGVRYFLNVVGSSKWKIQAADSSELAHKIKDDLENIMSDMDTPWNRVVRRAAMYKFYGFSVQEWTAKKNSDGVIGFKDIAPRPQVDIERWDVQQGEVVGMVQRSEQEQTEIYIPRWKTVYLVDDSLNDSPEGLGIFRHLVESSERLDRFEQLEAFGFETDLRGIPVARLPMARLQEAVNSGEITPADKLNAELPLKTFVKNHIKNPQLGLVLDSSVYESLDESSTPSSVKQWDLDLLKGGSTGQAEIAKSIKRVNEDIARLLGIEGQLLGSNSSGSQALSKDKSDNFLLIVDSTLNELKEAFENDFRDNLFRLNGWPEELRKKTKLVFDVVKYRDVTQITEALRDLSQAGAILDINDPAINEIRALLGLSKQEFDAALDSGLSENK